MGEFESISPKIRNEAGYPFALVLLDIVIQDLTIVIKQGKKGRGTDRKRRNQLSQFVDNIILYLIASIKSTRICLKPTNTFCKVAGYKHQHTKISSFLYNNDEHDERKKNQESNPTYNSFQK